MVLQCFIVSFFFFNDTATTEIYTLSLHDALPILGRSGARSPQSSIRRKRNMNVAFIGVGAMGRPMLARSEEHTSELQSLAYLVCRLLLEKKKNKKIINYLYETILC